MKKGSFAKINVILSLLGILFQGKSISSCVTILSKSKHLVTSLLHDFVSSHFFVQYFKKVSIRGVAEPAKGYPHLECSSTPKVVGFKGCRVSNIRMFIKPLDGKVPRGVAREVQTARFVEPETSQKHLN